MKTPKILNILGLAVALAAFMILQTQVRYDRSYNRCFADSERMYRVEQNANNQGYDHNIYEDGVADSLASLHGVEDVYQCLAYGKGCSVVEPTGIGGDLPEVTLFDTRFFDFFGFQCVDGTFGDLDDEEEVVLPKSLAVKLFPKVSAVGKTISLKEHFYGLYGHDSVIQRKIVAVYKDMPANNTFGNPLFFIRLPHWEYKVKQICKDSIRALRNKPEEFSAGVLCVDGKEDSLYADVWLTAKTSGQEGAVTEASNYVGLEPVEEEWLTVRASCDSNKPAPVMVERVMKDPSGVGSIYCKLEDGTHPDTLAAQLQPLFTKWFGDDEGAFVRLEAVNDIHFETDASYGYRDQTSRFVSNCLACIAWAVLLIAFLNFANFAIAEAPLRMRRVNTRKVLGESDGGIWWSMAKGYVTLSLVAFLIAFIVFLLCTRLPEIPMLSNPITLSGNLSIILTTLLLSIVVGVVVSLYPTRMVTVVSPDVALKGNYGFSKTGRRLRTLFIGLQFFLASVILTCTMYVAVQNRYLKTYDMGFQTKNILGFPASINHTQVDSFVNAIGQLVGVEKFTATSCPIVRKSGYVLYGRPVLNEREENVTSVEFNVMQIMPNFMDFFGVKLLEGRLPQDSDSIKYNQYVFFNRKAQETNHLQLNWHYGKKMMKTTVVGFVQDFHFRPLFDTIQPLGLEVGKYGQILQYFYVKYGEGADTSVIAREIRQLAKEFGCDNLEISTLDDDIAGFYEKEAGLSKGMFILCGIAVLLALMGVAGMLLLEMTYRRPELGLRQIFGSSTGQLLARANGKYALLCTVAFLLSVPVSLLLLRQWLKLFVAHAPIAVWIFLLAYVILLVLTALVVTVQSALSLRFEPVDTVRNS